MFTGGRVRETSLGGWRMSAVCVASRHKSIRTRALGTTVCERQSTYVGRARDAGSSRLRHRTDAKASATDRDLNDAAG